MRTLTKNAGGDNAVTPPPPPAPKHGPSLLGSLCCLSPESRANPLSCLLTTRPCFHPFCFTDGRKEAWRDEACTVTQPPRAEPGSVPPLADPRPLVLFLRGHLSTNKGETLKVGTLNSGYCWGMASYRAFYSSSLYLYCLNFYDKHVLIFTGFMNMKG